MSQTGKRNCPVLEKIQKRFGCGAIRYSANDGTYKYEVRSLDDLLTYILPFFQKLEHILISKSPSKYLIIANPT